MHSSHNGRQCLPLGRLLVFQQLEKLTSQIRIFAKLDVKNPESAENRGWL
jgi:hypothetical protein